MAELKPTTDDWNYQIMKFLKVITSIVLTTAVAAVLVVPVVAIAFPGNSKQVSYSGAAHNSIVATDIFTAKETVVCMVTSVSATRSMTTPTGHQSMWVLSKIAGSVEFGGPQTDAISGIGGLYSAQATRAFKIEAGWTAQFGCQLASSGTFANPSSRGT
jgi:hypothetical protein